MAASPELRQGVAGAVLGETQTVRSVDNSYLVSANLDTFSPTVLITGVTEDTDFYYVAYSLHTIDLVDYVWQPTDREDTIKVDKKAIESQDLGIYVSRQLKEVAESQIARIKETQEIERRNGTTQKVVATAYSGLIGKFLDTKEEKFPGYVPVVVPKEPEPLPVSVPNLTQNPPGESTQTGGQSIPVATDSSSLDNIPPSITIIGNNPFTVNVGDTYTDPGVLILDNKDIGLVPTISVDGIAVQGVSIDTSVAGRHTITYTAKDNAGNTTSVTREVEVISPTQSATTTPDTTISDTSVATSTPTSTPTSTSTTTDTSSSPPTTSESGTTTATSTIP